MRRLDSPFALLIAALIAPAAANATTAADICPATANPCTLSHMVTITPGSVLDFGGRDFTINGAGHLDVAGNDTLVIRAHRVTLQPGTGGRIRKLAASTSGPIITIETTENIVSQKSGISAGRIDVGAPDGGGQINLRAAGDVNLSGELLAQGTSVEADGGSINITAGGAVILANDVQVSGGLDAVGGDLTITATGFVLLTGGAVDVHGGLEGGSIDIEAGPSLTTTAKLDATGAAGGSDGGFISLEAKGNVTVSGAVTAAGSGSADTGGFGGDVSLTAGGTLRMSSKVDVSGGFPDGEGGTGDFSAGLDLFLTGQLDAQGTGDLAAGGTVLFTANRNASLAAPIDLHGGSQGGGGYLAVQASNVGAVAEINANGDGGFVLLSTTFASPTGPIVTGPVNVTGNVHAVGTPAGVGGALNFQGCDVTISASGVMNSGIGTGSDNLLQASGQLTVSGKVTSTGTNRIQFRDASKPPNVPPGSVVPAPSQTLTTTLPPCGTLATGVCGDGTRDPGEECDDGNRTACDGCSPTCKVEACGNGISECLEACDDGNVVDGDGCDHTCTFTGCGNAITTTPEQCDNGQFNGTEGDFCGADCLITGPDRCGNGRLDPGETCDDFNTEPCDGCSATCSIECGNGIVECAEACDRGAANGQPGVPCTADCVIICAVDTDCHPQGRCAGFDCDAGSCIQVTPLSCDDGNACTTDGCVAGACTNQPSPTDDQDVCTQDSCDPAQGVIHAQLAGTPSVTCRLDTIDALLNGSTDIVKGARNKISKAVVALRKKITAADQATTSKKKLKLLKAAGKQLTKLNKLITKARRKKQIKTDDLAARLSTAVTGANGAVETLRASVTPS